MSILHLRRSLSSLTTKYYLSSYYVVRSIRQPLVAYTNEHSFNYQYKSLSRYLTTTTTTNSIATTFKDKYSKEKVQADDDVSFNDNTDTSTIIQQREQLTDKEREYLQELAINQQSTALIRSVPTKVHNIYLTNLKIHGRLADVLGHYKRMKTIQLTLPLPKPPTKLQILPELVEQARRHPLFPLCNQLTEVYWDLTRAGWSPNRSIIRTMLRALAEREIEVQHQLEALERPNQIHAIGISSTTESIKPEPVQPEWYRLMAECNLEQAMTLFLSTPTEVRMSLHRTLLNLLIKAAAERGDPQAALNVFEWMDLGGHKLPVPSSPPPLPSASLPDIPKNKSDLLAGMSEFLAEGPFSTVAQAARLATRPSAIAHPSSVITNLFESQLDPYERRSIVANRMRRRLQSPTQVSYAELAGAFARSGDIVAALMCIQASEKMQHLFRTRQPDLVHRRIAEMLARRGDLGPAVWIIVCRMRMDDIVPSRDSLTNVTRAICDWGRVDYAVQFLKRVRRDAPVGYFKVLDGNNTLQKHQINNYRRNKNSSKIHQETTQENEYMTNDLFEPSYDVILEAACRYARKDRLLAQLAQRIFNRRRQKTSPFREATLRAYLSLMADMGDMPAVCEALAEIRATPQCSMMINAQSIVALLAREAALKAKLSPGERWVVPRKPAPPASMFKAIVQRSLYALLPLNVVGNSRQRVSWRQVNMPATLNSTIDDIGGRVTAQHLHWMRQIAIAAIQGADFIDISSHDNKVDHDIGSYLNSCDNRLIQAINESNRKSLQAVLARAITRNFRLYEYNGVTPGVQLAALVIETQIADDVCYNYTRRQLLDQYRKTNIQANEVDEEALLAKLLPYPPSIDHLNLKYFKDLFSVGGGLFHIESNNDDDDINSAISSYYIPPLLTERVDLATRLLSLVTPRLQQSFNNSSQPMEIKLALEMAVTLYGPTATGTTSPLLAKEQDEYVNNISGYTSMDERYNEQQRLNKHLDAQKALKMANCLLQLAN
ncbi:hypothetical protein BDF19DRAFT_426654 [Syncephalis fuscata]|nr:hypothetical protein BDF19DRAFT_426654 [Syncephalis fuscata]